MSEDLPNDEQKLMLSEDAIMALVSTLATEVVRYGEEEALLIENKALKDHESLAVMKANTLLTVFAMLLVRVIESKNIEFATAIINCWISPTVQDMVQIAFAEEIEEAARVVTNGINDIELAINKETNAKPSSEQGD
jgi:Ser-tRNA(Ala) deacylase AlaX